MVSICSGLNWMSSCSKKQGRKKEAWACHNGLHSFPCKECKWQFEVKEEIPTKKTMVFEINLKLVNTLVLIKIQNKLADSKYKSQCSSSEFTIMNAFTQQVKLNDALISYSVTHVLYVMSKNYTGTVVT